MLATVRPAPVTFRVIAIVSLLWTAFGTFDFVMTHARDPWYLSQLPAGMIDYIDRMPLWAIMAWAVGVGGAFIGSLLLVLRSRFAVAAFGVSLAGLALSTVHQLAGDMPDAMTTAPMIAMTAFIWIVAIGLLWYALIMRRAHILR